jgi:hypothetical protein
VRHGSEYQYRPQYWPMSSDDEVSRTNDVFWRDPPQYPTPRAISNRMESSGISKIAVNQKPEAVDPMPSAQIPF